MFYKRILSSEIIKPTSELLDSNNWIAVASGWESVSITIELKFWELNQIRTLYNASDSAKKVKENDIILEKAITNSL